MTTPRDAVERLFASDTASAEAGIRIESVDDGRVILSLEVRPEMTNGGGVAHGGWIFLLADTAFAFAATTRMPGVLTTDAHIRFHRPARAGSTMTATATVVEESRSTLLVDVDVHDTDGRRVASFRGAGRAPAAPGAPNARCDA